MFKIQEKGKPETAIWLVKENTVISNDGNGDLYFETARKEVSKVKIQVDGEKIYLADLSFNEPIYLNNEIIPAGSKRPLKHADSIQLGEVVFEIINPKMAVGNLDGGKTANQLQAERQWRLKAVGNWLDGQVFPLKNRTVIGRDNSCDITIPGSHLSRRHAEFLVAGHTLLLKDLDSANGSFVNGKTVKDATLKDGDIVKLDILSFRVMAPVETANPLRKPEVPTSGTTQNSAPINNAQTVLGQQELANRNWVTKPTSIGNRENDSLDLILAKHQRNKRILHSIFGVIVVTIALVIAYVLL